MADSVREPLTLRFLGSLIEQLGAQLYPGATATIAELVSNAWDADARNVWIEIPLGRSWTETDEIVVTDDGNGMSYDDSASRYLLVGRKRRVELNSDRSDGGRPLHGRKGIGKLAAFGAARVLECTTVDKLGEKTSFLLDYDAIRSLEPSEDYPVGLADDGSSLVGPDGDELDHGTRIRLSKLRPRRALNTEQFHRSLARRFSLDSEQMRVIVNSVEVTRFNYNLEIQFPRDGELFNEDVIVGEDGWAEMDLKDGPVKWWIGFSEKPLPDKELQGVSILARGKMVQRPFFFQRTAGAHGQIGQEYLIGEVRADWLDKGHDIDQDLIQANRDQLQIEDQRLEAFMAWGQDLVRIALREWSNLREKRIQQAIDLAEFDDLLERLTREERRRIRRVVQAVSRVPGIEVDDARSLVSALVSAHEDTIVRDMLEEIDANDPDFQTRIWEIVHRFGLIDARRNQTVIEARLKTIAELRRFVQDGAREVPTIHEHIRDNPWLLDPRWYLLDDEVSLSSLGIDIDFEERDGVMDYLFALGPSAPYTHDELLVVEIKRARHSDGRTRKVTHDEVSRFHRYVVAASNAQQITDPPLRVTGLMIAEGYLPQAAQLRNSFETLADPRLVFTTWDRVLAETERLHMGWLSVTKRRAQES